MGSVICLMSLQDSECLLLFLTPLLGTFTALKTLYCGGQALPQWQRKVTVNETVLYTYKQVQPSCVNGICRISFLPCASVTGCEWRQSLLLHLLGMTISSWPRPPCSEHCLWIWWMFQSCMKNLCSPWVIISFYICMVYAVIFDVLVPTTCSRNCQCMAIKLKTKSMYGGCNCFRK